MMEDGKGAKPFDEGIVQLEGSSRVVEDDGASGPSSKFVTGEGEGFRSRRYGLPKRRNVSAVRHFPKRRDVSAIRHFPVGCGMNASKVGSEETTVVTSSESKTGEKKLSVGGETSKKEVIRSREADGGTRATEPIIKTIFVDEVAKKVVEPKVKSSEPKNSDEDFMDKSPKVKDLGAKTMVKSHKPLNLDKEFSVKSPMLTNLQGKGTIKSPKSKNSYVEDMVKSSKSKNLEAVGGARSSNLNNLQGEGMVKSPKFKTDGEALAKSPKQLRDKNIMEEHKEKKFSMKSTSEKRMEESGAKQVIKNQIVKRSRDVSAPSGSKSVDKGGRSTMKKPIGNVSIKRSKDGNTRARNFSEEVQHEGHSARQLVKKTLRLFEKLVEEEETKSKETRRVDLKAAKILKENNKCVNHGKPILGDVPGVEVGDEFHYRVELAIIGVHRPYQGGIDYMKRGDGKIVATSIVASGGYPDDLDSSDVLIYSGSGGNPDTKKNKQAGDQKLERGNLALKNSMDAQTPVRVIFGSKEQLKSNYHDSRAKTVTTFIYDGLYLVEKYWTETGTLGFSVFKFQLRRMPRNQITQEDIHERE